MRLAPRVASFAQRTTIRKRRRRAPLCGAREWRLAGASRVTRGASDLLWAADDLRRVHPGRTRRAVLARLPAPAAAPVAPPAPHIPPRRRHGRSAAPAPPRRRDARRDRL